MDKRIRNFIAFSFILLLLFSFLIFITSYIYRNFSIAFYNKVLLFIIILLIVMVVIVVFSMLAVLHTYKNRYISTLLLFPVKLGLRIIIPFSIFIADLFHQNKDTIRSLFIDINNIIVQSLRLYYKPEEVLVVLPHCLQNSKCIYKITFDINNCKQCGNCSIGSILEIVKGKGVRAAVVTGGTAARNLIAKEKPGIVLSVACERDLAIGIADVNSIPVIGILNERPNGPCLNTTVNVELLKQKLENILHLNAYGNSEPEKT